MSQIYTINCFDANNAVQSDMQAIENNFETLRTLFSGSGSPANPIAGMPWAHPGGVNGLRMRDVANAAWLAVLVGDADYKVWLYRNDAAPGMQIDTTVSDRVLAIKGGTQAYNVAGGTGAGSWTITGLSNSTAGAHAHTGSGTTSTVSQTSAYASALTQNGANVHNHTYSFTTSYDNAHTHNIAHAGTSRPAAAVGTLQKPVLT
jgi:hypothetical protein